MTAESRVLASRRLAVAARSERRRSWAWRGAGFVAEPDVAVVEEPLTVHVERGGVRRMLGATMRTPGDDLELAVGIAVSEGVLHDLNELVTVQHCAPGTPGAPNEVVVRLTGADLAAESVRLRMSAPTSACGICGSDRIDELLALARPVTAEPPPAHVVAGLPDAMAEGQKVFRRTGGLHAAGIVDVHGSMLCIREDVGRHNAVDKVVGFALMNDLRPAALVVSGRAGYEIVHKAVMAGIPALASVSASTTLAIDAARYAGLTLASFVRGARMTVYSAPQWGLDTGMDEQSAN